MNRFLDGNETGLEGKIIAILCETLLQTKGQLPLDAEDATTGQLWYEKLLAYDKLIPRNPSPYTQNAEKLPESPQDNITTPNPK